MIVLHACMISGTAGHLPQEGKHELMQQKQLTSSLLDVGFLLEHRDAVRARKA